MHVVIIIFAVFRFELKYRKSYISRALSKSLIRFFKFVEVDYLMGDVCARNVWYEGDYEFHVFCLVE
jgi:hypothetical protein